MWLTCLFQHAFLRNTNIKLRLYVNEELNHHTPRATIKKERQRDRDDLGRVREIHDVIVKCKKESLSLVWKDENSVIQETTEA